MLTTSTSRFVDLRVYHNTSQPDDQDLPHDCGPIDQLDWAFAGTSSSQVIADHQGSHGFCKWEHWVDSRVVLGAEPQDDSARMYELENGMSLEKGFMRNDDGQTLPYEELWTDLPVESTEAESSKKVCVLAKMEEPARKARSMIVRVGRWVQGIIAKEGEVSVERWKWREESGSFERILKIGRQFLPCFIAFDENGDTQIGKTLEFDRMIWEILERHEWED